MPSGRPDWFGTIVSAGKYDTTFIPMAVDVNGALLALMKGAYNSALKTIAVDANGIMKANLSVQDLDFLTVRPAYGAINHHYASDGVPTSTLTSLHSDTGRGMLLGGHCWWGAAGSVKSMKIHLIIDGDTITDDTVATFQEKSIFKENISPVYLAEYDDDFYAYTVGLSRGITFESSFEIKAHHTYGSDVYVVHNIFWALVP